MRSILPSRVREGVEEVTFDPLDLQTGGLAIFLSERQRIGAHVDTNDPSRRKAVLEAESKNSRSGPEVDDHRARTRFAQRRHRLLPHHVRSRDAGSALVDRS